MYYPKSQLTTNLSTNGKEYQLVDTGESYVGSYFKTSDGKFYTGKTPQDGVNMLLPNNPIAKDKYLQDTPNSPSLPSDSEPTSPHKQTFL